MTSRHGLYGGSFDPIHYGHLIAARAMVERLDLEQVIFLPSARPPHKDGATFANPVHRGAMVKLAIEGEPRFAYNDFDLTRTGPTYTFDAVVHFRDQFGPDAELFWMIGMDSLAELPTWHRVGELLHTCRIIAMPRPGAGAIDWSALKRSLGEAPTARLRENVYDAPMIDISSTTVRRRTAQGRSIRYLVPEPVRQYIAAHGLYRTNSRPV